MKTTKLLAACAFLLCAPLAFAFLPPQTWKPWQFQGDELYEMRVVNHSGRGDAPDAMTIVLDIAPTEETGPGGEEQVTVSYTTRVAMPKSDLGAQTVFAGAAGLGMGPAFLIMNPMMTGFMDQVELAVGEKMALFGMGRIEVTGKEEIAGLEGFVCEMFGPKEQDEPLQFEWVVHPDLAVPLRSVTYDRGKKTFEVELLRHERR